jgi:hypothetical protein
MVAASTMIAKFLAQKQGWMSHGAVENVALMERPALEALRHPKSSLA